MIGALSLRLSSTPCVRCLNLGLRAVFPFANLCAFPSLAIVVWFWVLCQCLHGRQFQTASALSINHVDPNSSTVNCGTDEMVYRFPRPSHSRFWGLARWGHDPFPGGRAARHLAQPSSCSFCDAPQGDMFHCLSECAAFLNLNEQWCRRCSVHPDSIPFWVRHP